MCIKLMEPTLEYEAQVLKCRDELLSINSGFEGCAGLRGVSSFREWIDFENRFRQEYKGNYVPTRTFIVVREDDDTVVGFIDCRLELNDYLYRYGGHIGYLVMPKYRRLGYATKMLSQALEIYRSQYQIHDILITCDKSNVASRSTIIKCGGTLENEVYEGNTIIQRYWIHL